MQLGLVLIPGFLIGPSQQKVNLTIQCARSGNRQRSFPFGRGFCELAVLEQKPSPLIVCVPRTGVKFQSPFDQVTALGISPKREQKSSVSRIGLGGGMRML